MKTIYCVEDDQSIRELIVYTLKISGFEAIGYPDAQSLFNALSDKTRDLILLDIMLPDMSGLDILRRLKEDERYSDLPISMETAKTTEFDRVIGLDSGADDYLSKPFGMLEMVSRVQAVLRRSERSQSDGSEEIISYAGIKIDKKRHSVTVDGIGLDLTPKEYELLTCFTENPGIVFSRDQLLEKIFFLFECSLFVFFPRSYSW